MKLSIIFISIISLSILAFAKTNWYNIEDAIKLSKDSNKAIMVTVYTESCPYCLGYFNLLKNNKKLESAVNNSVYQVAIHEREANQLGLVGIRSVPAFLFFDNDLNECANPQYGLTPDINVLISKIQVNCKDAK